MMELLQLGYVTSVAATAGCTVERVDTDLWGMDVTFIRPPATPLEEEVMLLAQLKCTTQINPDPAKDTFSYQFTKRQYFDHLAKPRRNFKSVLIVMTTPPIQADWTEVTHGGLLTRRACYWKHLEGMHADASIQKPSVKISTSDVFDAQTLIKLMDRVDRGDSLHG
ncbi:DUF4365 domain-containing protein [Kitasatospora sp. YST-16]|uniref:DUF4365 domain-containing protein n=1 Tax=Kitasatospora sp. YST-16 TaxID=2998080 RepID=UPI0022850154|nr:DUF4365 domain-containing protein [Kitasatospora sp. YST-16]WAL71660.1 DUF4365 domain-containing protein [Kitasatospora sp. YST-16]WNW37701.1 DUF4365 domain-containing protein [Streptomyces sp. Li-HN-5-13]